MKEYFPDIDHIVYKGTEDEQLLAYHYYNPEKLVHGKTMEEWLKLSVCYWHSFCWPGLDMFGGPTFDHPWFKNTKTEKAMYAKTDAAFELIEKLGVKYFCFHDIDIAFEEKTLEETLGLVKKSDE